MSTQRGQPIASRAPWVLVLSVVLVVPGTLLSVAFSAIGAIMLVALAADWLARAGELAGAGEAAERPRRLPVLVQIAIGVGAAAAIGGGIALGAWIV